MMLGVPQIAHILTKQVKGGVAGAIEALRADDAEDSIKFIKHHDSLSKSDLKILTIEEVAMGAGLRPRRIVELVTGALMQQTQDFTKLMIAAAQHEVVATTIKAAKVAKTGLEDRRDFYKITGLFPTAKGPTFNINQTNQTANLGSGQAQSPSAPALPPPSADSFLLDLQRTTRGQLNAPEAPAADFPVNAPDLEYLPIRDGDDL